jgi:ribonucleotide monophosphatase NagD (HAD superfamily)
MSQHHVACNILHLAAFCLQLVYASACLRELPGCLFVATNLDHADYIGNNRMMPGTGALVAALQVASGVQPVSWMLLLQCCC